MKSHDPSSSLPLRTPKCHMASKIVKKPIKKVKNVPKVDDEPAEAEHSTIHEPYISPEAIATAKVYVRRVKSVLYRAAE